MSSPFDLTGRSAVVTGGSRGIGLAIASGLLRAGADVTGLQRSPFPASATALAASQGRRLTHVPVDLGSSESIATAATAALELGPVDILVNNAGNQIRHDAVEFPLADFDAVLQVHLRAVFQLCQAFGAPMLARGWGRIVNLASVTTFQGGLRVPAYAAAKGAIGSLTKALCNEWAGRGVCVNAIAPGYIDTEMNQALVDDPVRYEQLSVRIPAGRWGTADDLAGAAVFLSSDAAAYVHGAVLPVDGGWLAR